MKFCFQTTFIAFAISNSSLSLFVERLPFSFYLIISALFDDCCSLKHFPLANNYRRGGRKRRARQQVQYCFRCSEPEWKGSAVASRTAAASNATKHVIGSGLPLKELLPPISMSFILRNMYHSTLLCCWFLYLSLSKYSRMPCCLLPLVSFHLTLRTINDGLVF